MMRIPSILLSLCFSALAFSEDRRPNIVVIITDDLGYADVGFNGSSDIKTPALDKLAEGGTICSSGYAVHPFCGPSRAGLMTGRYPHEFGSQYNLPRNSDSVVGFGIPLQEVFISEVLQEAGYYTGAVGKWHLGANDEYSPNGRGFDDFFGFRGGGHKYFPNKYQAAYEKQLKAGVEVIVDNICPLERNGQEVRETEYLTDAFSREAVRFVEDASQRDQPFFLYLAYNAPHSPMEAPAEDVARYSHIPDKKRRVYAAMVDIVDRGVEQLLGALVDKGVYDNTLIVFLSDNGGKLKYGSNNAPLRGEKGETAEGGHRVPMFFHWPEVVPAGRTYEHPISALDFYPTFLSLAKASLPTGKQLDGVDIWDRFLAGESAREGEPLFSMRYEGNATQVGIRVDNWKANYDGSDWELYNLSSDPGEDHDLSSRYPERLTFLRAKANFWSDTHVEPKWIHDQERGRHWNPNLPNFEKLFDAN
ncbi:sulfatase family protein [Pelagicoccus mobilis]|uniref:Sulfatase-like hydrolase/transferase n=1 Tax=Pelagicoccus mobilis TaxID=415221 RepID=A0A934RSU9_9BACT|nr:sulfatase-like hydrolase/transferase [Pelagicoccus mobilis]MBK1875803.1 sulfatase-like hydrolase/transferase [Pelagicoccus mobilis]